MSKSVVGEKLDTLLLSERQCVSTLMISIQVFILAESNGKYEDGDAGVEYFFSRLLALFTSFVFSWSVLFKHFLLYGE